MWIVGLTLTAGLFMVAWAIGDLLAGAGPADVIVDLVMAAILFFVAATLVRRQKAPVGPVAYNVLYPHGSVEQANSNVYRNPLMRPEE